MKNNWQEVGSWNVGTSDGGVEKYTLSENKQTGDFRIKNDFGNITIDMERMSGYKFLKKVVKQMESVIPVNCDDYAIDIWTDSLGLDFYDDTTDNNCDYTD
jgi:hypothetical protein